MGPAVLAAGAVVWFAIAGVGMGFLLEPGLRPLVRRSLHALKVSDGLKHADPTIDEVALWTRRSSRATGFAMFFLGAVVIGIIPIEDEARRSVLVVFAGVIPLLGYVVRLRGRSKQ